MPVLEYKAHPRQIDVLQSEKRVTFFGAGVGSGKTDCGSVWTMRQAAKTPKGSSGLIVANTYQQLIDSTLANFYRKMAEFQHPVFPPSLPQRAPGPFSIYLPANGHLCEIKCRSLDNFKSLAGIEVPWFWADEVYQTSQEAAFLLWGRLRQKTMENRCLLTTTLDDPTTWMYETFVDKYDEKTMNVIYCPTYDNEHNLPPGYIESLKTLYTKEMFERMVLAKWVSLSQSRIYYAFDREKHVQEFADFDPALPILWAHDFNIGEGKPMSSCLAHLRKGGDGIELHVFDEIILDSSDTNDAILEMKNRPWLENSNSCVITYGDASGRARDTRSKFTDYSLLSAAGFRDQKVPLQNPPVRERHNLVNTLLRNANGVTRLYVHPRCKTLAKGLEITRLKPGAQYLEDDSIREQHVTTALGYLICAEFKIAR